MASGNSLLHFGPAGSIPPASNYMTLDSRNGHLCLDADASTEETVSWEAVLPRNYAGGGLTARIAWMASSATTGSVVWGGAIERHDDEGLDLDADSFATEQTATGAAPATNGMVQYTEITFSAGANMDSLAIDEHFRFKLARKVADGSDDMAGDAEVLSVAIRET